MPTSETKKQVRWFRTDVNFERSFKFWFALQWQNSYLQLFVVALVITTLEFINFGWVIDAIKDGFNDSIMGGLFSVMGCLIGPTMMSVIAYKGFYQYFDDLSKGRSR